MNYYLEVETCTKCHSKKRWHVGKSSNGWKFHFHGLVSADSPTGQALRSYSAWKKAFRSVKRATLMDEEGNEIGLAAFNAKVKSKQLDEYMSPVEYAYRRGYTDHCAYWLDPEGYEFSSGDFS